MGSPPNCKPECISNSECPNDLACINQKCRDPCPGSCGVNAVCRVVSHTPNCACKIGYTGDAFLQCIQIETLQPVNYINPCVPSPCGPNAICREQNNAGSCTCLPNYIGNPYEGCRPECVLNTDCASNRACIRNKCLDPCPGTCATNAECQVVNHLPSCTCAPGYTGDPFVLCKVLVESRKFPLHCIWCCDVHFAFLQLHHRKIHVFLPLAAPTASVAIETDRRFVVACQVTWEVPRAVDPNV